MILRIAVRNFRSLGEAELDLRHLTALVGPNGAGKSNLLQVLRFVSDAMHRPLEEAIADQYGINSVRRWTPDRSEPVRVQIDIENDEGHGFWAFELSADQPVAEVLREEAAWSALDPEKDGLPPRPDFTDTAAWDPRWRGGLGANGPRRDGRKPKLQIRFQSTARHPDFFVPRHPSSILLKGLVDELSAVQIYRIAPEGLRMPSLRHRPYPLDPRGTNWASTLQAMNKQAEGQDFLSAMNQVAGDITDFEVKEFDDRLSVRFRHGRADPACWFSMDRESDGTLRTAALVTALLQSPSPTLIGLEEPELYMHPGALPVLYDLLRQASRQSQVVLTTHSPDLMDLFEPEDLRVVERVGGLTSVGPVDQRQVTLIRDKLLGVGDLLHAEGLHREAAPNGHG